jgi:UDP-N-acetylmuramate: L-alanyl-gamma-D-glutamyl-meso-diaminopimelate ligase
VEGDDTGGVAAHWSAAIAEERPEGTSFDLFAGGMLVGRFVSPLSGVHNLRNVVAALAACAQGYGVPLRSLLVPLSEFQGVKRRQEVIGRPRDITVYDDFAHHPTAVSETLRGLRTRHPSGKLIAIFEPRSATACRRLHQKAYESAFDSASHVLLAPVGRPELPDDEKLSVSELGHALSSRPVKGDAQSLVAEALPDVPAIVARAKALAEPGDTIAVLSNGAFGGIHAELLSALGEKA